MGLLSELLYACVSVSVSVCLSSVNFCLPVSCFFSDSLSLIMIKLGMSHRKAKRYKITELILNICINYAN